MARVPATSKAKWLERTKHDETNRGGIPTSRVKGRRKRNPRWHTDPVTGMPTKPVGMDMLKVVVLEDGTPNYVNNTGSYGFRTTYGTYLSIIVRTSGPNGKARARQGGKGRGAKRVNGNRNPGILYHARVSPHEYWINKVNSVLYARNLLMKARVIENITDGTMKLLSRWQSEALDALDGWLKKQLTPPKFDEMVKKDQHRLSCLLGEFKKGDLKASTAVKLSQDIDRAMWLTCNGIG